jgi:biotin operon repressor
MSNHLISEVYKRQIGTLAQNAVMVLLADKASDDGTGIWASKQRMADELGTTKQTVITTIKALIAAGLLREAGRRQSPNGYTVEYEINVNALHALPLVPSHRSSSLTGQPASPVKQGDPTGKAARPKPSKTPLRDLADAKSKRASKSVSDFTVPGWMPAEAWAAFLDMRNRKGAWPSPGAVDLIVDKLERWKAQGHDPGEILNTSTMNNWTGVFEPKATRNDTGKPSRDHRDGYTRSLDRRLGIGGDEVAPDAAG